MHVQVKSRINRLSLSAVCISMLYACGGGGSENVAANITPNIPALPTTPTFPVKPATPMPTLAAAITLDDGTSVGRISFPTGPTASGAKGQLTQGLSCVKPAKPSAVYGYAHLNILVDGQLIAVPDNIGLASPGSGEIADPALREIGCYYPLLTNDTSGKIRTQSGGTYTLGQFFALWGQPLSYTNIAGYAGKPIKVFVKDGATLTEYTGSLDALPLNSNREITIQIGTELSQLPNFVWTNPPPSATTSVAIEFGARDAASTGQQGVLQGNTTNGQGGQGATVDGISCYGPKNGNTFNFTYHVHSHLSIFRDGVRLAIPEQIGIVGDENVPSSRCEYALHTHDATGQLHTEAFNAATNTLGQFFNIWGQPLSRTNIAGQTNMPVVVYIRDGGNLRKYQGDLASIELRSYRSIVIQLGTPLNEIPAYDLVSEPQ